MDDHKLLCMRNPWGREEWKGRWADNSSEWTPRYKKLLGYSDANDGKFWIAFEDFVRVFITVYTCKVLRNASCASLRSAWSSGLCGGSRNRSENPQFLLRSTETESVTLVWSLIEDDHASDDTVYAAMYVLDIRGKRAKDIYTNDVVAKTSYSGMRDISLDFTVWSHYNKLFHNNSRVIFDCGDDWDVLSRSPRGNH